jgi:hypothetical protein
MLRHVIDNEHSEHARLDRGFAARGKMAPRVPEVAPVVGSPLTTSYEPRSHDFARVDGSAVSKAASASSGKGPWVGAGLGLTVVDGELVGSGSAAPLPVLGDGSVAGAHRGGCLRRA